MAKEKNNPAASETDAADIASLQAENAALKQAVAELTAENDALKKVNQATLPGVVHKGQALELQASKFIVGLKGHALFGQTVGQAELSEDEELREWALNMGLLAAPGKEGE